MKRRKREPTEAESDQKIVDLLNVSPIDGSVSEHISASGEEEEKGEEEVLDKSFISLDVEKERQLTFSEIENPWIDYSSNDKYYSKLINLLFCDSELIIKIVPHAYQ